MLGRGKGKKGSKKEGETSIARRGVIADTGEDVEAKTPEQAQAIALSEREGMDLLAELSPAKQADFRALGEAIAKLDLTGLPKLGYVECKADGTVAAKRGFAVRMVKPGQWELDIIHKLDGDYPVLHTVPKNKKASPVLSQRENSRLKWTIELKNQDDWLGPLVNCDFILYTTNFVSEQQALQLGGMSEEEAKRLTSVVRSPTPKPNDGIIDPMNDK